jgi:hypothetical protein
MKRVNISVETFYVFCFFTCLSILIAFRDYSVGIDTSTYAKYFVNAAEIEGLSATKFGLSYKLYMQFVSIFSNSPQFFFFTVSLFISMLLYLSYAELLKDKGYSYIIIFISLLLLSGWYITEITNGIRQGMALVILYWSIFKYLKNDRYFLFAVFLFIAIGFHQSVYLILPFLLLYKIKFKYTLFIWAILAVAYVIGLNENIVKYMSDLLNVNTYKFIKYYSLLDKSMSGFGNYEGLRWDLFLYTIFWPLLYFFIYGKRSNDEVFSFIVKTYLILSMPYFVFGFGPYSNRYAVIGWFFLPFLQIITIMKIKFEKNTFVIVVISIPIVAIFYFLLVRLEWFRLYINI